MEINEMVERAFNTATVKGWHDEGFEKLPLECHMLMVSEIAEASEEVRKGTMPFYFEMNGKMVEPFDLSLAAFTVAEGFKLDGTINQKVLKKPEGELIELADVMIRIGDYCGSRGWDLNAAVELKMKYNSTRSIRHGKLK